MKPSELKLKSEALSKKTLKWALKREALEKERLELIKENEAIQKILNKYTALPLLPNITRRPDCWDYHEPWCNMLLRDESASKRTCNCHTYSNRVEVLSREY